MFTPQTGQGLHVVWPVMLFQTVQVVVFLFYFALGAIKHNLDANRSTKSPALGCH